MADSVVRFLFEALDIRGAVVQLGSAWRDMAARRDYPEAVRNLLGQLAAVTTVIGGNLKAEGRITFQLQGQGPVSMLLMDCQPVTGGPIRLRGVARTQAQVGAGGTAIGPLLGDGQLVLTLHQNEAQAYQSVVPLDGDTLAAVFEHYLAQSEQQPARLWLAADGECACALFLQALPGAHEKDADGWNRISQLAATVTTAELRLPPAQLLTRLFAEDDVRLFEPRPVCWYCPRDEQKVRDVLLTLGRAEVESMLADGDAIEVNDDICGHQYRFGREVLDELFPPKRHLH